MLLFDTYLYLLECTCSRLKNVVLYIQVLQYILGKQALVAHLLTWLI